MVPGRATLQGSLIAGGGCVHTKMYWANLLLLAVWHVDHAWCAVLRWVWHTSSKGYVRTYMPTAYLPNIYIHAYIRTCAKLLYVRIMCAYHTHVFDVAGVL